MTSQPQPTETLTLEKSSLVPLRFGEDGGRFYKYYDELADELDEDLVTSLKAQLDGILIFAGLFAGVNSAFLAFTLPQLSPDPTDDTNALLFQIMINGGNTTIRSTDDLPSASFAPPRGLLPINILFSLSLTLALVASFLAVLGQQWLVYYRKKSGVGKEHQRWEQLRRHLGAKRWGLELVLDTLLPSVLQIALVLFSVAFVLYLGTLSKGLCYAIAAPLAVTGTLVLVMIIVSAWDRWCPFTSPFAVLARPIVQAFLKYGGLVICIPTVYVRTLAEWVVYVHQSGETPFSRTYPDPSYPEDSDTIYGLSKVTRTEIQIAARNVGRISLRAGETSDELKVLAVLRMLRTSEDTQALIHTALNGQSLYQSDLLRSKILENTSFRAEFDAMRDVPYDGNSGDLEWTYSWTMISLYFSVVVEADLFKSMFGPEDIPVLESLGGDDVETNIVSHVAVSLWFKLLPLHMLSLYRPDMAKNYSTSLHYLLQVAYRLLDDDPMDFNEQDIAAISEVKSQRITRLEGVTRSFGNSWIAAWALTMSRDRYGLSGQAFKSDPNWGVWSLTRIRDFFHLYKSMNVRKQVGVFLNALETSGSDWPYHPSHDVYADLLLETITSMGALNSNSDSVCRALKYLLHFLRATHRRIRDSAISAEERNRARQHIIDCTQAWVSYSEDLQLENVDNWVHYTKAKDEFTGFLRCTRDLVIESPQDGDGLVFWKFVSDLRRFCLLNPEYISTFIQTGDQFDLMFAREAGWLQEDTIAAYKELYSFVGKVAEEIEAVTQSSHTVTESGRDFRVKQGQNTSTRNCKWWGN